MDQPPTYEAAQAAKNPNTLLSPPSGEHQSRNGIPPTIRRSMEDEYRELPPGWVRLYDAKENHQYFVDTQASPPRSIWHHPYDDEHFLAGLDSAERERIQTLHKVPNAADLKAESTDDEGHHDSKDGLPPRPGSSSAGPQNKTLGRRLKDKLTGSTHEEREAYRRRRYAEERKQYEAHLAFRQAMSRAAETGEPQLLGKDRDGKDVYVEPPSGYGYGMQPGAYGYNPYQRGPYSNPNARYIRPGNPYNRPYGGGFGGGYGMPLAGGLMGGMLLGGLLF